MGSQARCPPCPQTWSIGETSGKAPLISICTLPRTMSGPAPPTCSAAPPTRLPGRAARTTRPLWRAAPRPRAGGRAGRFPGVRPTRRGASCAPGESPAGAATPPPSSASPDTCRPWRGALVPPGPRYGGWVRRQCCCRVRCIPSRQLSWGGEARCRRWCVWWRSVHAVLLLITPFHQRWNGGRLRGERTHLSGSSAQRSAFYLGERSQRAEEDSGSADYHSPRQ